MNSPAAAASTQSTPEADPESKRRALADRPWAAVLLAMASNFLFFALFLSTASICYESNDDTALMQIASGVETGEPSEYLVFTNILIGRALKWLYLHYPGTNWYSIYLLATHFLAMTALLWSLLRLTDARAALCLFFLLAAGFELRMLLNLQFTSTAIMAGWSGAVLLLVAEARYERGRFPLAVPAGMALLAISVAVREQAFFLVVCLSAPLFIAAWLRRPSRRLIAWCVGAIGLSLVLMSYHRWEYSRDPKWREFVAYNAMRGQMQDFPVVAFADNTRFFFRRVGWNDVDYYAFRNFFAVSDGTASPETLRRVFDLFGTAQGTRPGWHKNFDAHVLFTRGQLGLTAALLALVLIICGGRLMQVLPAVLAQTGIVTGLIYYLAIYGKLELRVTVPTLACLSASYFVVLYTSGVSALPRRIAAIGDSPFFRPGVRLVQAGIIAGCASAMFTVAWQYVTINTKNQTNHVAFNFLLDEVVRRNDAAEPKPIYVLWKRQMPFLWDSPFATRPELLNLSMIRLGWNVHSPLLTQLLEKHDINDLYLAILERPEILLMAPEEDTSFLKSYMQQHYYLDVKSEIPNYLVYDHSDPIGTRMMFVRKMHLEDTKGNVASDSRRGGAP